MGQRVRIVRPRHNRAATLLDSVEDDNERMFWGKVVLDVSKTMEGSSMLGGVEVR